MSRTVPKTFKRPSYYLQGNLSNVTSPQQSSSYFPQHLSLDLSKEKDLITPLKDVNPHSTTSQTSIKKLGLLLDPHKDRSLAAQVMTSTTTGSSMHASPKSLLEVSKKFSKLKSTNATNTSGEFTLISPKDLVRKAMSKLKTKENSKEMQRTASATSKNFRKSLSLRFTPQLTDKKDENLKTLSTTYEENLPLTRTTSVSNNKEKAAKLRRMKKIYNDDLLRLSRSNTYSSPQDSMHLWTESGTPNKSLSGGMWSVMVSMPNSTTNKQAKQYFGTMGHMEHLEKQKIRSGSKGEKSHKKVGSLDQLDLRPKEYKTSLRSRGSTGIQQGQKSVEMRKYRAEHKAMSMSFTGNHSRVGSQFNINNDGIGRPNSPLLNQHGIVQEESHDTEVLLTDEGTLSMEQREAKDLKGKGGSINELKNWTSNLSFDEQRERKTTEAERNVKHAQETMLERLREALGSEEYVKREDYERVVQEKRELEEFVDAVREENEKLRAFFVQLKNSGWGQGQDGNQGLKELCVKQQKELEILKRREGAVKNVLKMIYQTGIDMNEFNEGNEEQLFTETQYTEEGEGQLLNTLNTEQEQDQEMTTVNYTAKESNYSLIGNGQEDSIQKSDGTLSEIMTTEGKAMSEIKEDDQESSIILFNAAKKNVAEAKSTADSSPIYSSKLKNPIANLKTKMYNRLKLDLTSLGTNGSQPKSHVFSSQSSGDKFHIGNYIMTDGCQSVGFHDEFMSKLEEFSESWRQAAMLQKKF